MKFKIVMVIIMILIFIYSILTVYIELKEQPVNNTTKQNNIINITNNTTNQTVNTTEEGWSDVWDFVFENRTKNS